MCKSWCEFIIGALVLVFSIWQVAYSRTILIILGIVLLIHSLACKGCFACEACDMNVKEPMKSKRRK